MGKEKTVIHSPVGVSPSAMLKLLSPRKEKLLKFRLFISFHLLF